MSTILLTLILAFVIVVIALGLLGLGWLITGKSRIRPGACGRDPHKRQSKEEGCGDDITCSLCEKKETKEKK